MLIVRQGYEEAIAQAVRLLANAGLEVVRTFDLQSACADQPGGVCPHHGTAPCNCQLAVLLVYGQAEAPAALVAHSCDGQTWFSVVTGPLQRADPQLESAIERAMSPIASWGAYSDEF
jgi:hypothetical protein